jgi:hypothetical protein
MQRIFNKNFSWNLTESNQKKKYFGHFHSCKEIFFSSLKLKNDFLTRSSQKFRNEGKKEIKLEEEIL